MNKTLFILSTAILVLLSNSTNAQTYELVNHYSAANISALAASFGIPSNLYQADYGVDAYKITYTMPYMGETIEVSGAMFVPTDVPESCELPVHTYMHGTIFIRDEAPSNMPFEAIVGYIMSSPGYITLMPDYVGLGESDLMHPYIHSESEAEAGIYMLEAVTLIGEEIGFSYNGEQLISGYSQGGHAAMAMAREIQENWSDTYEVTACAPQAGPYNMSEIQGPLSVDVDAYPSPAYFAYNVVGWNSFYGNIYDDLSEIFQEPYASMLPDMLDGETGAGEINAVLPTLIVDLLQPGIVEEILNNSNHPYMLAAADNNCHDWVPNCHMNMYYCNSDDVVYPENTLSAYEYMIANGAENVGTFDGGDLGHGDCAGPSIFGGLLWMDQFHQDCVPESVSDFANGITSWGIAPNPAQSGFTTLIGVPLNTQWIVRDMTGRIVKTGNTNTVELGKSKGIYFIEVEGMGIQKILN